MRTSLIPAGMAVVTVALVAGQATAASVAFDHAGNYASWTDGSNAGSGFGAWDINTTGNTAAFLASPRNNGNGTAAGVGDIASANGNAFGTFAAGGSLVEAVRPFTNDLTVGQTFRVDLDNGFIDGGTVGFALRDGGSNLFEFFFQGGTAAYTVNGSNVTRTAGNDIGFTDDGLRTSFTLTGNNSFSFQVEQVNGGALTTWTGNLLTAGGIDNFRFFNAGAGGGFQTNDAFFNNLQIVPIPTPAAAGGAVVLLSGVLTRRRR